MASGKLLMRHSRFCYSLSVPEFPRSTCMPPPAGGNFRAVLACRHVLLLVWQFRNFRAVLACRHLLLPKCQFRNFRAALACRHLLVGISAQYLHAVTCCCQIVSSGISAQHLHAVTCCGSLSVLEFPRSTCMPPVAAGNFRVVVACRHMLLPVCQCWNFRAVLASRHLVLPVCHAWEHPSATFNEPFAVSPQRGPQQAQNWKPAAGGKASISLHVYAVQNAFLAFGRPSPLQRFRRRRLMSHSQFHRIQAHTETCGDGVVI